MQNYTAGKTGLLSRQAARVRTAAVSKSEFLEYFDMVGYSEAEIEDLVERINRATNLRAAEQVMQEVADADPGLFGIRDGTPETTNNVVIDINAGDTYAPTLVFDEGLGRIELMTWGDAVEAYDRAYYKSNFMDGVTAREVGFEVEFERMLVPEEISKLERKFESTLEQSMGGSSDKVVWKGAMSQWNEEYNSLYCEGSFTDGGFGMRDFLSNEGITSGILHAWGEVGDVMKETLTEFLYEELSSFGVRDIPHMDIRGIDRPEQVEQPDYYHL